MVQLLDPLGVARLPKGAALKVAARRLDFIRAMYSTDAALRSRLERTVTVWAEGLLHDFQAHWRGEQDIDRTLQWGLKGRQLLTALRPDLKVAGVAGLRSGERLLRMSSQYLLREADNGWDDGEPQEFEDFVLDYLFDPTSDLAKLIVNVSDTVKEEIRTIIRVGYEDKRYVTDIAGQIYRELEQRFPEITRNRAQCIARTEIIRSYNNGAMAFWKREKVGYVIWLALDDSAQYPCHCYEYWQESKAHPWNIYEAAIPPDHPNCRCCLAPVAAWEMEMAA